MSNLFQATQLNVPVFTTIIGVTTNEKGKVLPSAIY